MPSVDSAGGAVGGFTLTIHTPPSKTPLPNAIKNLRREDDYADAGSGLSMDEMMGDEDSFFDSEEDDEGKGLF
jgi:hypothetical protein